ncbi:MAG: hypothetical protein H2069_07335 [Legionella sp.]|nr:hypothetical protein [Legionella sp.]
MGVLALIISGCANGFITSSLWAYEREVQDGGTANRTWSFIVQYALLYATCNAFTTILPVLSGALNVPYYLGVGFLAGLNYLATICHKNRLNADIPEKIVKLPYNLHQNRVFLKILNFLSANVFYVLAGLYLVPLLYACFFGILSFSVASLITIGANIAYQRGFFPNFLKKPYFLLAFFLVTANFLGINSWLTIGLSVASFAFSIWDYIQCHVRGKTSPSSQFPIAKLAHDYKVPRENLNRSRLLNELEKIESRKVRLTFNHFHEGFKVLDKILKGAPKKDYQRFATLFNQLNFEDPAIKDTVLNYMAADQKFCLKTLDDHRKNLKLPLDVSAHSIKVAYLKREMQRMVSRLNNQSYRDLSAEQIATLHGYARHLLEYLDNGAKPDEKTGILLNLAMNSGSLCNRGYLETMSGFEKSFRRYPLSLKEEIILMTQTMREEAFRQYYFKVAGNLREQSILFQWTWRDLHDYHTYEDFVSYFGGSFYLRNPALCSRVRSPIQLCLIRGMEKFMPEHLLFKHYYTEQYLLDQIISGKLSALFQRWCDSLYPGCYNEVVLDDNFLVKKEDPRVKRLAEMMLLDCGIVELSIPFEQKNNLPVGAKRAVKSEKNHHVGLRFFRKREKPSNNTIFIETHEEKIYQKQENLPCRSFSP